MADNRTERVDTADAAQQLNRGMPAETIDGALGPNWQTWQDHVAKHVQLPDTDNDGKVDPETPVVPLLVYGDGPNDYISTDIDAGQVIVRDGNDPTGKAWKYPLEAFLRFVAHANGKELEGEEKEKGDNPLVAAIKQQKRTNALRDAERKSADAATRAGETRTGK